MRQMSLFAEGKEANKYLQKLVMTETGNKLPLSYYISYL